MFDNANPNGNQSSGANGFNGTGAAGNPGAGGGFGNGSTPPANPMNRAASSQPGQGPIEDIFSQMDTPKVKPAILQPKTAGALADSGQEPDHIAMKNEMDMKRIILAGLGLGGLILIFIGAWYSYNVLSAKKNQTQGQTNTTNKVDDKSQNNAASGNQNGTGQNQTQNENTNPADANQTNTPTGQNPTDPNSLTGIDIVGQQAGIGDSQNTTTSTSTNSLQVPEGHDASVNSSTWDSDNDGLTDNEEAQLGTNPLKVDTDDDGLFDNEEVKTYKTDPLNADTDGDGYKDGSEVKNGYNPKGPGKLTDVPQ